MSDTPTTAGDAPQREMTLAEYMAQLPIFHRAHREYVELLQDRAALPSVPVDDKPAPTPHTFVPAMDGGSASCAECGESWPCSAWIEQQRVRRDDPALLRQAVVECLPPEIVKLAEDIYAPTLGGMLMEYVAELEGQLEERRVASDPLPSAEVEAAIKHFGKTVCAIARVQPTWTLTAVMNDPEARRCAKSLLALLSAPVQTSGETERDAARWRALLRKGGRIRVLGSAGLGANRKESGYAHIGLELWTIHPSGDDTAFGIERLTEFADIGATLDRTPPFPSPEDVR